MNIVVECAFYVNGFIVFIPILSSNLIADLILVLVVTLVGLGYMIVRASMLLNDQCYANECKCKCKCKNHFYCAPYRLTEGTLQTAGL